MTAIARVSQKDDDLFVSPLLGSLPEMKTLGATWHQGSKSWKMAAALMNLRAVQGLLMDVIIDDSVTVEEFIDWKTIPDLDSRLFGFQKEGVSRLVNAPRGQLLCATPGLGKTVMAIVAADLIVGNDQVVIVAPASLLRTWEREIARWSNGGLATIVRGTGVDWDEVQASRWIIMSWDILARHQDWFEGRWPLWIFDESVLVKSRRSQRSMAVTGGRKSSKIKADGTRTQEKKWTNLRKDVEKVWLLSGSPTTRYADDLWKQLAIIYPRAFRSYWRFAERYCVIEDTVWSRVITGTRRDRDAVEDNADLMYVISQEDVLDLPEYLFEAIDVDLTTKQQIAYDDMERKFIAELDSGDLLVAQAKISQLQALQRITSYWEGSSAKHDALIELIESGVYEMPMLIWTHWKESAKALTMSLRGIASVVHVYGDMSELDKDKSIEAYKKGKVDILVLSLGVGKFGHTLTNTKTVVYIDKTWNADDYHQSLRRVRRIGLSHSPVVVTVRAPKTVDRLVEMNLEGKIESIARVTNTDLKELILGLGKG